ncbi:MAG TPA: xanthine dehydrogenase family protein subunit M [Alphaproteobacteria bacterium]
MNPFAYARAGDMAQAIATVAGDPEAAFLAGGTTLVDLMKEGVETHHMVVDINALPLGEVTADRDGVHVGAMVRNSDLGRHPLIRDRYPMLAEAMLAGASGQLRNMATVGGNLMQRTRCPYFRDLATPCNKRVPNSGCSAMEGYNRGHAVLGTSDACIATHPSDMAVALVALDAVVRMSGPQGERRVPIGDFHRLPGKSPHLETALEHGELITGIDLPDVPVAAHSRYLKVRDRASYEFALASAAVALRVEDGRVKEARIALGGIATKPWRAAAAEQNLIGQPPDEDSFRRVAHVALAGAQPRQYNAFKVGLAKRTIVSALTQVVRLG